MICAPCRETADQNSVLKVEAARLNTRIELLPHQSCTGCECQHNIYGRTVGQ